MAKKPKEDRKRFFVVDGGVYKQEILFCFNMTPKEAIKILKNTYQSCTKEDEENILSDETHESVGIVGTMYKLSKGYLVLLKWRKDSFRSNLTVAMHEILHVTNSVMKLVDIPFSQESEHAYIYLAEFYLHEFLRKVY